MWSNTKRALSNNWNYVLLGCGLVLFLCNLAAFYPGFMSMDSLNHLREAKGLIPLTDLQPPAEPLLWKTLIHFTGNIAAMLSLQLSLLWTALYALAYFIYRQTKSKKLSLLAFSIGLLPIVINISGVIWSDNQMTFALLLAVAACLYLTKTTGSVQKWLLLAGSAILITYACLVRYNAIFAVIPLLYLVINQSGVVEKIRFRWLATLAAAVIMVGLIFLVKSLSGAYHVSATSGLMLDDIVHISSAQDIKNRAIAEPLKDTLTSIKNCTAERNVVIDSFWNCSTAVDRANLLVLHVGDLQATWLDSITSRPLNYLIYKLESFELFLFPSPGTAYIWQKGIEPNELGLSPKFQRVGNMVNIYVNNFGYKHFSFLYEPWFWLVLSGVLLGYSRKLRQYSAFVVALSSSSIVYILGFIPTGATPDYRYIYWPVVACLVSLLLIIVGRTASVGTNHKAVEKHSA